MLSTRATLLAAQGADQLGQVAADVALRPGVSFDQRVGAIAHHRQHALLTEAREGLLVYCGADERLGVELPIPGVQDRAVRRPEHQGLRLWQGMRDRHELELERRQVERPARREGMEPYLAHQPYLAQLAAQHGGGERRRVYGTAELTPKVGYGTDMVLVRVGDHKSDKLLAPFRDERRVGHHDLDLGVLAPAEADAAVDGEPLAAASIQIEVHADLTRPTQGQEGEITAESVH